MSPTDELPEPTPTHPVAVPATSATRAAGSNDARAKVVDAYESALARLLLTAVDELAGDGEAGVTSRHLVNFLRGTQAPPERPGAPGSGRLYGVLAQSSAVWLREVVHRLVESGELQEVAPVRAERVRLTKWGRELLENRAALALDVLPPHVSLGTHPALEARLRALRRRLAEKEGRAPYGIFPNRALAALAAARPRDLAELAGIPGFGATRIRRYGAAILAALREEPPAEPPAD